MHTHSAGKKLVGEAREEAEHDPCEKDPPERVRQTGRERKHIVHPKGLRARRDKSRLRARK